MSWRLIVAWWVIVCAQWIACPVPAQDESVTADPLETEVPTASPDDVQQSPATTRP